MRLLHTSDWHLGHTLHDVSREHEHRRFFAWLLDVLEDRRVDALLVTGDVFDSANPPAEAQRMLYELIVEARRRLPQLQTVIIGGNHDSAARLDAPRSVLGALGVHVVGGLPRDGARIDVDRLLVRLRGADGGGALCVALPYLRPADLPGVAGEDPLIGGVRAIHDEVLAEAARRREDGDALVVTGHCYMTGASLSELSERKILGGNLHALPVDLYPENVTYAALGHLHRPQAVGGREAVRYAGSPIPLAFDEEPYPHQVVIVELAGGDLRGIEAVRVPRSVQILRVPADGPGLPDAVLELLAALPERGDDQATDELPFLEVRLRLEAPDPTLKARVEAAVEGKAARLLRTHVERSAAGALADREGRRDIQELQPGDVFLHRYRALYPDGGEPSAALVEAFHELLEEAQRGEEP